MTALDKLKNGPLDPALGVGFHSVYHITASDDGGTNTCIDTPSHSTSVR